MVFAALAVSPMFGCSSPEEMETAATTGDAPDYREARPPNGRRVVQLTTRGAVGSGGQMGSKQLRVVGRVVSTPHRAISSSYTLTGGL